MTDLNELPVGQRRLIENLRNTQKKHYELLNSCMDKLASGDVEDLEASRIILLKEPQDLDGIQQKLLGILFKDLIALQYEQQDLVRQIDEYIARSAPPGRPSPQLLPKYECPRPDCNYIDYQFSPSQPVGNCPHHDLPLRRKS